MKKEKKNYANKGDKLRFLLIFLLTIGISSGTIFRTVSAIEVDAIDSEKLRMEREVDIISPVGKEISMDEIKDKTEENAFIDESKKNIEKQKVEKKLTEKVNNAKRHFDTNQKNLRIVQNIATSTISQLHLEGTEVTELKEDLNFFERSISEIEILYKDYLNEVIEFKNGRGPDPGDLENVLVNTQIKKRELNDFYQETFRKNIENALIKNEEEKVNKENVLKNKTQ